MALKGTKHQKSFAESVLKVIVEAFGPLQLTLTSTGLSLKKFSKRLSELNTNLHGEIIPAINKLPKDLDRLNAAFEHASWIISENNKGICLILVIYSHFLNYSLISLCSCKSQCSGLFIF